jgi:DNA-binding response OmpR family regulator
MVAGVDPASPKPTREERLAAQLRANLRRRKEQARALRESSQPARDPSQSD